MLPRRSRLQAPILPPLPACVALTATCVRLASMAVTVEGLGLEGLGLGVPLSPGSGWQVQAVEVSTIAFLP